MNEQSNEVTQRAAIGSNTTQIGVQNNNYGVSVSDVIQLIQTYIVPLRYEFLAEMEKMLEEKLRDIPQENITRPNLRVAVPALQKASITEEDEIRELYANLLANSMDTVVKNGVHPGFVEIINQLCPDEAKILRYFSTQKIIPTVTLKFSNKDNSGISVVKNFSNIGEIVGCEKPFEINAYFDNLIRLGLLRASPALSALVDKKKYEPLKAHPYFKPYIDSVKNHEVKYVKTDFEEGYMELTDYGILFCRICLNVPKAVIKIVQQKD